MAACAPDANNMQAIAPAPVTFFIMISQFVVFNVVVVLLLRLSNDAARKKFMDYFRYHHALFYSSPLDQDNNASN
jgi:hypothetical protein